MEIYSDRINLQLKIVILKFLVTRVNYWINISFSTFVKNTYNRLIYVAFSFGVARACEFHCTSHMSFKQIRWLF